MAEGKLKIVLQKPDGSLASDDETAFFLSEWFASGLLLALDQWTKKVGVLSYDVDQVLEITLGRSLALSTAFERDLQTTLENVRTVAENYRELDRQKRRKESLQ